MNLLSLSFAVSAVAVSAVAASAQANESKKQSHKKLEAPKVAAAAAAAQAPALTPISLSGPGALETPRSAGPESAPIVMSLSTQTAVPGTPTLLAAPSEEKIKLEKLQTLNQIDQQELVRRLRPINEEREETAARYNLGFEKTKLDVASMEAELRKLQLEQALVEERRRRESSALRAEVEKLRLENERARAKLESEQIKSDEDGLRIAIQMRDLDFQSRKIKLEAEVADHRSTALKADLELREKKDAWKKGTDRDPEYPKEPFKDGVLTISDRRIPLKGPIVYGTADYITERIDYFNNKSSELPIYIVIDRSPGGSVMEGYRILKAMQTSKAPVHVVVKQFAASMAATMASLAPKSYAYPNAIILHHQIWSIAFGNPTQQKQQLENMNEWNRRLLSPVAKKMGLSLEALTKKMYEHNVDGDWEEFADEAVKLKWIDHVAQEIRETGVLKEPETKPEEKPKFMFGLAEESDAKGDRFVRLPRLQPYDAYFIYNKDQYYR